MAAANMTTSIAVRELRGENDLKWLAFRAGLSELDIKLFETGIAPSAFAAMKLQGTAHALKRDDLAAVFESAAMVAFIRRDAKLAAAASRILRDDRLEAFRGPLSDLLDAIVKSVK